MKALVVDDTVVDDNNIRVKQTIDLFISLVSICNDEHLSYCNCQDNLIKEYYEQLWISELQDLEERGLIDNTEIVHERQQHTKTRAIKLAGNFCTENGIKCPIELEKIKTNIGFFESKYALDDPRVYVIVDALMNQMLSAYRMQAHSSAKGILQAWYDKHGNKGYSLNPVEECKLKYDNARINAISVLDKIMEGQKINLKGDITVKDVDDLFKDVTDIKEGEYREL